MHTAVCVASPSEQKANKGRSRLKRATYADDERREMWLAVYLDLARADLGLCLWLEMSRVWGHPLGCSSGGWRVTEWDISSRLAAHLLTLLNSSSQLSSQLSTPAQTKSSQVKNNEARHRRCSR